MMMSTHILVGANIGLLSYFLDPSLLSIAVFSGALGGLLPELDNLFDHRKTFHRPLEYLVAASLSLPLLIFYTSPLTVLIFFGLLSASIHSFMEILSQGDEWRSTKKSEKAVYNHLNGEWIKPRRWIEMGSFRDFSLSFLLSIPLIYFFSGGIRYLAIICIIYSLIYFLMRRSMVFEKILTNLTDS